MVWSLEDKDFKKESLLLNETLHSLANGYLGVRGNFEEGYFSDLKSIRGTYINGFHDRTEIEYGEKLHGFPDQQEKMLNIIDAQTVIIQINGERFSLFSGEIVDFKRTLYMDKGMSSREVTWISPKGHKVRISFNRLVSFVRKELMVQEVIIEPLNGQIELSIESVLNGDVTNYVDKDDPRIASGHSKRMDVIEAAYKDNNSVIVNQTYETKMKVAAASKTFVNDQSFKKEVQNSDDKTITEYLKGSTSEAVVFHKYSLYMDELRHGEYLSIDLCTMMTEISKLTFEEIKLEQKAYMDRFWDVSDVVIEGDPKLQEGIRFNLFHLLQSVGKDKNSNIAAKGLSGEGYEGHYFWDTEIYMFPVFLMTNPEIAKNLLLNRHSILESAKKRAKEVGHTKGALFPWRTIVGGESSAFFPAGTAQYHISADIAYSFVKYFEVTGDLSFFKKYASEVLFETARLWLDTGHFYKGQFRIDDVTGPDEYTCIVNNNYYTNAMAKHNLEWAVKAYEILKEDQSLFTAMMNKTGVKMEEVNQWVEASEKMYLPFDEELNINAQDDTFLQKKRWDLENTPSDQFPLLLHYHPLTLYRYQVCKQADTILAHFLLDGLEDDQVMKDSYHYYEGVTTHDSSLSYCVFSIMASKFGDQNKAYNYFNKTARLDIDNIHKNTKDGLHMANMGGTWMALVYGFAGLRIKNQELHFAHQLPEQISNLSFSVIFHNSTININIDQSGVKYSLTSGESVIIYHEGMKFHLKNSEYFGK